MEIEAPDAGEDVPDLGPWLAGEFGRSKVAPEKGAGGTIGHACEICARESMEERVRFRDAAGRDDRRMGSRMVEPGEGQRVEFGVEFREAVKQCERLGAATDEGTVGAEPFGLGVSAANETTLEAVALVARVKLFARRNALWIAWWGIEVESADEAEVEHGNQPR